MKVAETAAELATLEERAATMRTAGWTHEEVIDAAELRRVLPAVAPHAVDGLIARRNGFAQPCTAPRLPSVVPRRPPAPWCGRAPG